MVFGSGSRGVGYESFAWRGAPMSDQFFVYAPSTLYLLLTALGCWHV